MAAFVPEYQPRCSAKADFQNQLVATDKAARNLKEEISTLSQALQHPPAIDPKDSDMHHKLEMLRAVSSSLIGIKKVLKMKDIAIEEEYDALEEGHPRKVELARLYNLKRQFLSLYEVRIYNIISAPSSWFMIACSDASNWLYENPIKAMCLAAGCGALGGGSFAAYYAANGYCVIWWLFTGCACGGWGMLSSTVMGTVIGGGGGALLVAMVGVSIKVYNESYATEKAPADLKKINDMVDNLNKLPDADFARQLEEIMAGTDALCSIVPATEDRVCVVCLEEGQDVISPVRATRCKGPHFLCKTCWARCVTEWSDKCPVCLA